MNTYSQSNDELKAKIEKLNKEMAKNMIQGNNEANLSFYTPDAISLPSYETMHEGVEAIKKSNAEMMSSGMKVKSFETKTLKVITYDKIVTEIGTYKISISMPNTEAPMDDNGKYLTIWEKQKDGSLKIKIEMWNTDNNPWEHMEHKTAEGGM
jgi:ketosteroid isomerase-like protein